LGTNSLIMRINALFSVGVDGDRRASVTSRVLTILLGSLLPFTILILVGWSAGYFNPEGMITILLLDITMGICKLMAGQGRWRPISYAPPFVFYLIGLYGSYTAGLITIGLLFYVIAILIAAHLMGNKVQWLILGLSLASHLTVSWFVEKEIIGPDWFTTAMMVSASFVGIALLQLFSTRQLQTALEQSRDRANELQNINRVISVEIEERRRAETALRASEVRFRTAFQTSPDAIVIIRMEDGRYLDVNEGFTSLTGYSQSETVGNSTLGIDFWHDPQDRQRVYAEVQKQGVVTNLETQFRRKDGTLRTGLLSARMIFLNDLPHILYIIRDIEERRRAEKALLESESRYRSLFESNRSVMLLVEPESDQIVDVNPAACEYYGYTRENLIGKKFSVISAQPVSAEPFSDTGLSHSSNHRLHRLSNGEIRDVEVNSGPLIMDGKQLVYFIVHDITERIQREREIKAMLNVAETLRTSPDRHAMLEALLQKLCEFWNAKGVVLGTLDVISHSTVVEMGAGPAAPEKGRHYPPGTGLLGKVIELGEPILKEAIENHASCLNTSIPLALICAPLKSNAETIGAILVGRAENFDDDDMRLLSTISEMTASAVQRATLYEETQRRLHHLNALHTIDMAIAGSTEIKGTLSIVLEQIVAQLCTDAADILVYKANSMDLRYAVRRGFEQTMIWDGDMRIGNGLAGKIVRERCQVFHPDLMKVSADHDPRFETWQQEGFVSYFGLPLIAKGEVKGVLELFHRSRLNPNDEWMNYLDILAGQTAIAIDNSSLFEGLQKANLELILAYDTTLEGWAKALELRDKETQGHSQRVTELTVRLARKLGIDEENLVHVRRGALLHDIGKMAIPDSILQKPGPLDEEEWGIMRLHPGYAYELLSKIDFLKPALDIPYHHHERWDGKGYPLRLRGEEIPLAARAFTLIDVWDALRSERPYRQSWPDEKVYAYLRENAGIQFDPLLVDVFLELVEEPPLSIRRPVKFLQDAQQKALLHNRSR